MEISTPELRFRDYLRFVGGVKEDERVTLVIQIYICSMVPNARGLAGSISRNFW